MSVKGLTPLVAFDEGLGGDWTCRTMKLGGISGLIVYTLFKCRLTFQGNGYTFEKLSGSQRTSGFLSLRDGRAVYVGVGYVAGSIPPAYADLAADFEGDGEIQPDIANCWNNLGVALYRNGQSSEAVETLEKARAMNGGNDPYHQFFLAMAYWQTGQRDKSLEHYTQATEWLESDDRGEEQRRFKAEAESLIKMSDVTEDAPAETTNHEPSEE